jgi:O-antigen/teichoic acid export membrane protein
VVVPGEAAGAVVAVAPTAGIAVAVAGTDGILRAEGEFRRPVLIVTASRLGAFAAVPLAAASGSATLTCIGISAGTVVCSLPALRLLVARLRAGVGRKTVRAFAGVAAPLGVSNAAIVASARLNTVILGGIATLRAAAVFESAWRLIQVGQYAFGGAPTAAAPFIASALSGRRIKELRHTLRRTGLMVIVGGGMFAGALIVARGPLDRALFGTLGPSIGRSLLWLAPALPLNLLMLLMSIALASVSSADRRWIAVAYVAGAGVNLAVLLAIVHSDPDVAGSVAAASGILATTLILGARLLALLTRLGLGGARSSPPGPPAPTRPPPA